MHDKEIALRAHIRNILLDYARKHLTTDYVSFTQDVVAKLLEESLIEIPTTDPYSLILPEDPFDRLFRLYKLQSLSPFDEKLATETVSLTLIKRMMQSSAIAPGGVLKTEGTWYKDGPAHDPNLGRRISPVLTTRAIRTTPKLGSNTFFKSLPSVGSAFLRTQLVRPVQVEEAVEPVLETDHILNMRFTWSNDEVSAMQTLLNATKLLSAPDTTYTNKYLTSFLRGDAPPSSYRPPERPFMPVFPRNRLPGCATHAHSPPGLRQISDLPEMLPTRIKVEDDNGDLYEQNMILVDGWQTYNVSSPPSLNSSQAEDQFDQLFLQSSPDTDPAPIQLMMKSKMEVIVPRTRKVGGVSKKPKVLGEGQSLSSFLLPLLPELPAVESTAVTLPPRLSPEPPMSLLGQPSSPFRGPVDLFACDLNVAITAIYAEVVSQKAEDVVLMEKLEERDEHLMDVPVLPPPNVHPPGEISLPTSFKVFVAPLKRDSVVAQQKPRLGQGFLKKTKLQAVNMELSWAPFKSIDRLPTSDEVTRVSTPPGTDAVHRGDMTEHHSHEMVEALLLGALIDRKDHDAVVNDEWDLRHFTNILTEGQAGRSASSTNVTRFAIVSTRAERQRLSGICCDGQEIIIDAEEGVAEYDEEDRDQDEGLDTEIQRPSKRPRLDLDYDGQSHVNDSGIALNTRITTSSAELFDDVLQFPDFGPGLDNQVTPFSVYSYNDDSGPNFLPTKTDQARYDYQPSNAEFSHQQEVFTQYQHEDGGVEDYGSGFMPLSFDSNQVLSARPSQYQIDPVVLAGDLPDLDFAAKDTSMTYDMLNPPLTETRSGVDSNNYLSTLILASNPLGVAAFAGLRAKPVRDTTSQTVVTNPVSNSLPETSSSLPRAIPEEAYGCDTVRIPSHWQFPTSLHRYMASVDVIQKSIFTRALRSHQCSVDLVERHSLGGVELIVDSNAAIMFMPIFVLPSQCEALISRLVEQSWRYSSLLVIFEAYPESDCYHVNSTVGTAPFAYTPPILKALRKLRRGLAIVEACGDKRASTKIWLSFADTVDDAAILTRQFGDFAEAADETQGAVWGDRDWLDGDAHENEADLASVDGMNTFAAAVIFCQCPLQEFLDLTPDARIEEFSQLVGSERITLFNDEIERRFQVIQSSDLADGVQDLPSEWDV